MPPEPSAEPEVEANARACDCAPGSEAAWAESTAERMVRKCGLVVRESGVGGRAVVVPMARDGVGGVVGRRVRRWEVVGAWGLGKTYWWFDQLVSVRKV